MTLAEGNYSNGTATFTVSLSKVVPFPVTINYATADGTATAGSDYIAASGTLTFAAGETSKSINVTIIGDTVKEPDETFYVKLSVPTDSSAAGNSYITIARGQGVGTIKNDDFPMLSVTNDVRLTEGNSGTQLATFTVSLSAAVPFPVTVKYATADGTATAGSDYTATSGTVTFAAGETSKSVSVPVIGDTVIESDETFTFNISAPTSATIDRGQRVCTIVNDDFPTLSINDVSLTEGNSGTRPATFTISLSQAVPFPVTVNYGTANGTATAGSDYYGTNGTGTIIFAGGQTSASISISVIGDTVVEPNETFYVNLSAPTNATIARGQGVGTIVNDDIPTATAALRSESGSGDAAAEPRGEIKPMPIPLAGSNLLVAVDGATGEASKAGALTSETLKALVAAAIDRWAAAGIAPNRLTIWAMLMSGSPTSPAPTWGWRPRASS